MNTRPDISATLAAEIAGAWGLSGTIVELGSYADRNFAVTEADGRRHVLKIAAVDEDRSVLEMQQAALIRLAGRGSAAVLPRVVATAAGETLRAIVDEGGRPTWAWVISWIHGRPWTIDAVAPGQRRALGRALGRLDRDLEGFSHPALRRPLRWNLAQADWIGAHLEVLRGLDGDAQQLVLEALAGFRARVMPRLAELPWQAIHGDANDQNLLLAADGPALVGLIDFGDMCWAPTVCELAIAMAYAIMSLGSDAGTLAACGETPHDTSLGLSAAGFVAETCSGSTTAAFRLRASDENPGARSRDGFRHRLLAACGELTAGYHEQRPLSALEADLLFDLLRARLAVSVCSSALAQAREPDNAYVVASQRPAWALLAQLRDLGRRRFATAIAEACALPAPEPALDPVELQARRTRRLGSALSLSYRRPLCIVRGQGTWLFDQDDRPFLDCVNNVCHVGHAHPRVVAAATRQIARLNTNTRYLHPGILDYADRLCATLPPSLEVVFMVNSGSEANELALRLARAATGGYDVAVVDAAYHGNTGALIDLSPYKFAGPGGGGRKPWVHVIPTPDPRRGAHGDDGPAYAAVLDDAGAAGRRLAALFCEPVMGCAGQVVPATGFLPAAFERARAAGAVCVADEVQVGFGRVGDGMWAFAAEGVVPDILTLGKPIGNGHPIGAVVTTRAIADALGAGGMEFFSSFGGNPVSCAIAGAVLDVIEDEGLIDNARDVGEALRIGLRALAADDPGIGDVRGRGLFLGVALIEPGRDGAGPGEARPDPARARAIVEHARERGVLLSVDGPAHDVIKIKPPIVMDRLEAQILLATLAEALAATRRSPRAPG